MTRYTLVPGESTARIRARSTVHPVDSVSTGIEGFVDVELMDGGRVDLAVLPKARIEMPLGQLTSGNLLYDREMRRRVDARRYPVIEGELTGMDETASAGRYLVAGEVTFHGTTRAYTDEMQLTWPSPDEIRLEGHHTFDIRDFGVEPPRIMLMRVHPDVLVQVRLVGRAEE